MPLLQFARYREIAAELANSADQAIVASGGLASSILWRAAALHGRPVSIRLSMLDAFARRIVNDSGEYPRVATDSERRLAMRTAAAAIDDSMMETRGIVAMMERTYRDIRDSGITLDEFQRRAGNRGRTQILIRAWRAYEQLIARLPAVDPADVLERAAVLIESGASVPQQIVAGFYDMTGAQLRLLSALDAAGKVSRVLVPIGEGSAYAFASRFVTQLNSVLSPQSSVLHVKAPKTTVEQYATKEAELRAVCAAIRELLDAGTPANDIGIVARALDPDDVRMLQRFAAELGIAITARNNVSLNAHRLGRGVSAVLRLRDRNFQRAEVIDILRDGYQPRQHANVDRLDIATRQIRMWRDELALEDFKKVVAELESLAPVSRTLLGAGWAALLGRIAAKFRLDTELDLAAAAALDDIIALLGRWNHQIDLPTVLELIENTELRQPITDNRQPVVWAGDVMKFRGRSFEHLFVIRAQETTLPQRRVDDPLLPDSERRQAGVREIGDGRDEERLLFQLLLDGTSTSVRFSFAGSDTFGKSLRPSRMLRPFGVAAGLPARRVAETAAPTQRQLQLLARAGTRSPFDGYLDDEKIYALIANELQAISPTELENFGECPQKFFLKRVLRVIDYDDPDRELQMPAREKGKLDHTILERFYRSLGAFPPSDFRERLGALVDEAFDEEETRVPAFNRVMRAIERRATKRNLHAFLTEDIEDLVANGLRPAHFEYKFGPEPFVITEHDVPIMMKGVIDRIDEGAETLRIVDYKSGKALRHLNLSDKIDRGMRLQLALYAMAVAKFFNAPNVSGAIKPLMAGSKAEKFTFDLADAGARLRETIDLFIASMLRGRFPAFPDEESCRYCPVNHSCRTKHSDAERRALEPFEDPRGVLESLA